MHAVRSRQPQALGTLLPSAGLPASSKAPWTTLPPAGGSLSPSPRPVPSPRLRPLRPLRGEGAGPAHVPPPAPVGAHPSSQRSPARGQSADSPRNATEERAGGCSLHPPLLRSAPAGGGRRGTTLPSMPRGSPPLPQPTATPSAAGADVVGPQRTAAHPRPEGAAPPLPGRSGVRVLAPAERGGGRGLFCARVERGRGVWGSGEGSSNS